MKSKKNALYCFRPSDGANNNTIVTAPHIILSSRNLFECKLLVSKNHQNMVLVDRFEGPVR